MTGILVVIAVLLALLLAAGVLYAGQIVRAARLLRERAQTSGVHIGDVQGGIRDAIIAGRDVIVNNWFTDSQSEERKRRNQLVLLDKVQNFWVDGVLEQSLHGAALIELGLDMHTGQTEENAYPWDMVVQRPDQPHSPLPAGATIVDVFDEMHSALLILGQPGSGKTTVLLALAQALVERARQDPSQPIPVVFNLSSWSEKRPPVKAWLVDELRQKYEIPNKVAVDWVENDLLLYLLDGLDEVQETYREACVVAINQFQDSRKTVGQLVVCSRIADYEALTTRLDLAGAVVLQPLTPEQVGDYLKKLERPEFLAIQETLQHNSSLQELFETPLMLSMVNLTYQGENSARWPELVAADAPQKELFSTYIERMFNRDVRTRSEAEPYTKEQTIRWLSWLATKMHQHSQSLFLIEAMQPDWLLPGLSGAQTGAARHPRLLQYLYATRIIQALIVGLLGGLAFGLVADMRYSFRVNGAGLWLGDLTLSVGENLLANLLQGQLLGLLIGLLTGLAVATLDVIYADSRNNENNSKSNDENNNSHRLMPFSSRAHDLGKRRPFTIALARGIASGLTAGLIGGLIGNVLDGDPDQPFSYAGATIFGFGNGLLFGIEGRRQDIRQDIRTTEALSISWGRLVRGLATGLLIGLFIGFLAGVLLESVGALLAGNRGDYLLQRSVARGLFYGLDMGLVFALAGAVQGGLNVEIFDKKIYPNQGIRLSIRNAILVGLLVSLLSLLLFGLVFGLLFDVSLGLSIGLVVGTVLGLLAMLWYGSFDIVQHGVLRLLLYLDGHIPCDYAHFLDYAAERIFLRKVGGGYIFIHRLLMDHFAE